MEKMKTLKKKMIKKLKTDIDDIDDLELKEQTMCPPSMNHGKSNKNATH